MLSTTVTGDARVEAVVDGVVGADDFAALLRTIDEESRRNGPVRLLATLRRYGGFSVPDLRSRVAALHASASVHRYAVVVADDRVRASVPGELAAVPIDGRAFADRDEALAWLEDSPRPSPSVG